MSLTRRGFVGALAATAVAAVVPFQWAKQKFQRWMIGKCMFCVGFDEDENGEFVPTMKYVDHGSGSTIKVESFYFAQEKAGGRTYIQAIVRPRKSEESDYEWTAVMPSGVGR